MADNSSGGGNGTKLAIAVQEEKIDNILDLLNQQNAILNTYFGAEGVCPIERGKNAATRLQTKWQWKAIVGVSVAGSGWLGYVTRLMIEHFQRGG
jgi:hypothetical protein